MSDTKMQYGWICPICGRGLSPLTSICPCKDGAGVTLSYTPDPKFYTYNDLKYIDSTPTTKGDY